MKKNQALGPRSSENLTDELQKLAAELDPWYDNDAVKIIIYTEENPPPPGVVPWTIQIDGRGHEKSDGE